jgi:hypothetical protein
MLRPTQISDKITEIARGDLSIDDFARWFRSASKNFQAYSDKQAIAAIFDIESVLSEYRDGLDERSTQEELAAAIRPFEEVTHKIPWQRIPPQIEEQCSVGSLSWSLVQLSASAVRT